MPKKHVDGLERRNAKGHPLPLYALWLAIRNRCNNPEGQDYAYYGGRGIEVCDRWDSYAIFAADVGPHPGRGWTLDRIDNDCDYEPDNVRWATRQTQGRNRNYCKLDLAKAAAIRAAYRPGVSQEALAKQYGVSQVHISKVIRGIVW